MKSPSTTQLYRQESSHTLFVNYCGLNSMCPPPFMFKPSHPSDGVSRFGASRVQFHTSRVNTLYQEDTRNNPHHICTHVSSQGDTICQKRPTPTPGSKPAGTWILKLPRKSFLASNGETEFYCSQAIQCFVKPMNRVRSNTPY